jgi:hypothetical protein
MPRRIDERDAGRIAVCSWQVQRRGCDELHELQRRLRMPRRLQRQRAWSVRLCCWSLLGVR